MAETRSVFLPIPAARGWLNQYGTTSLEGMIIQALLEEYETARVKAYRAARLLEPDMDRYEAAMSVYEASFGKHPGDVEIVATQH